MSQGTGRCRRAPLLTRAAVLPGLAAETIEAKEIALHPEVRAAFDRYRARPRPGAFSREESRRRLGIDSDAADGRVDAARPGEAGRYLP